MAEHTTKVYKNTFSGSVGAGMGSLFNPKGRKYYILEHKVSSKYHKAGETQEIIVDNIELGRDPHCQVRFDDENFRTVSRHHAAIVRDGEMWKLVQLSKKNSTFLNGHPIKTEWYLQSGDEIQLSVNGPKLGFIVPTGKKSTVASIGLTRRMSLFRKQALRPYKYALTTMACVLVLAIAGLGTWNYFLRDELGKQSTLLAQQIDELSEQKEITQEQKAKADSLAKELVANNEKMAGYEEKMVRMVKETEKAKAEAAAARKEASDAYAEASKAIAEVNKSEPDLENQCFPYTYAVYQVKQITRYKDLIEEDNDVRLIGSGFLLSDGRFITARHVTETYCYCFANWGDERINQELIQQNVIINNGGDIQTTFVAVNHEGKTITFTNKQCKANRSQDLLKTINIEGTSLNVKVATANTTDWVSYKTSGVGAPFDNVLSANLAAGTHLKIFGFPHGRGGESPSAISPIFSSAEVARKGLDVDGTIMTSNTDTQSGNSGGPVFTLKDGVYCVVGILSGDTRGKGRIVPIQCAR